MKQIQHSPWTNGRTMRSNKSLLGVGLLTCTLVVSGYSQSFLTNGLVAYYTFSGNANDISGHGNNGSIIGSDWKFSLDRFAEPTNSLFLNTTSAPAFNLDGAYVSAPRPVGLDFNSNFTLCVWVNLSSGSGTTNLPENLISNGSDASSVNLRIDSYYGGGGTDLLQFLWGGPNSGVNVNLSAVRQTWWQITVVHSGTNLTLFKNGSVVTNGFVLPTVNSSNIWIGRHDNGGINGSYYPLVGGIDDVRMYNRALSASEVQQLYALEAPSFLASGLVAYYTFGGNANDMSGNGNNGSIIGNDWRFSLDRFAEPTNSLFLNTTSAPAFNLDGAYASAPRPAGLDFNNDFTLSVWVNLSSASGTTNLPENLISNGSDATSVNLRILSTQDQFGGKDGLQFLWGLPSLGFYAVLNPIRQAWWQITVVRSGTNCTLYKNGSYLTNSMAQPTANSSTVLFGRHDNGGINGSYYPLVGGIDDVRMYNRALSASEVQQLYALEAPPSPPPYCQPSPSGIVAWWTGDGTPNDRYGTHNGVPVNAATFTPGIVGQCFSFNGTNSYLSVSNTTDLNFHDTTPMTIEFWAYRNTLGGFGQNIIGKRVGCDGDPNEIQYQISFDQQSGLIFGSYRGFAKTFLDMPQNQWTHLAGTFDGTTLRFYINGYFAASLAAPLGPTNNMPLQIGQVGSCAGFGGLVDEISLYNRALSSSEIQAIFLAGSLGKCKQPVVTGIRREADGDILLDFRGDAGRNISILFSQDVISWSLLAILPNNYGTNRFIDPSPWMPAKFYRLSQ
jgi:hypothetical protein